MVDDNTHTTAWYNRGIIHYPVYLSYHGFVIAQVDP